MYKIDTVFVLMIFCIFAISVFLVLMLAGSIYQNITDIAREGQNEGITLSYIRGKIRSSDSAGSISVDEFYGLPALSIKENIGGSTFVTLIYLYNGWVYELFYQSYPSYQSYQSYQSESGHKFLPGAGVPIIRAGSLNFEEFYDDNNLIRVSTDYGSLLIFLRSSERECVS